MPKSDDIKKPVPFRAHADQLSRWKRRASAEGKSFQRWAEEKLESEAASARLERKLDRILAALIDSEG